jgi:putative membrane protein
MKITNIDKEKIKLAIKEVELKTSGEIVPVILSQSDFYPAAHFRLALIIGIFSSLICYYTYDFDDPILLIWSQVLGLIVGYLLAYLPFLKRIFTTQKEINEEVYQRSLEIFYENMYPF